MIAHRRRRVVSRHRGDQDGGGARAAACSAPAKRRNPRGRQVDTGATLKLITNRNGTPIPFATSRRGCPLLRAPSRSIERQGGGGAAPSGTAAAPPRIVGSFQPLAEHHAAPAGQRPLAPRQHQGSAVYHARRQPSRSSSMMLRVEQSIDTGKYAMYKEPPQSQCARRSITA